MTASVIGFKLKQACVLILVKLALAVQVGPLSEVSLNERSRRVSAY
jgi:hypothetical protein